VACPSRSFVDLTSYVSRSFRPIVNVLLTNTETTLSSPHHIQNLKLQTCSYQTVKTMYHGRQISSPSSRSLVDLPDDILSRILEESEVNPLELRTLSHGMFKIVMHNPCYWTTIRPDNSLARIKLSLEHSRKRSLDVNLTLNYHKYSQILLSLFQEHH
jgi:hypothetical protein